MFITYYEEEQPVKECKDRILNAITERNDKVLKVCDAISSLATMAYENLKEDNVTPSTV